MTSKQKKKGTNKRNKCQDKQNGENDWKQVNPRINEQTPTLKAPTSRSKAEDTDEHRESTINNIRK